MGKLSKIVSLAVLFMTTPVFALTDLVATGVINKDKSYFYSTGYFFQNNNGSPDQMAEEICQTHSMKFVSQESSRETSYLKGFFEVVCGLKSTYCSIQPLLNEFSLKSNPEKNDWVQDFSNQLKQERNLSTDLAVGATSGSTLILHGIDLITTVRYSFQKLFCD
jgi:hypothetical protein